MQGFDWNDLRHALALHRSGTLSGAGRALGVNETTAARRLRALERRLGAPLFIRTDAGRYEATDIGLAVIDRAQRMESESQAISDVVGRLKETVEGMVRVTATPMIVHRILVPQFERFRRAAPGVTLELLPDSRNLSLTRREADLAVRLARPVAGGRLARARRIGALDYAAYGPAALDDAAAASLSWIGYAESHAHLPQARWLERVAEDGRGLSTLRATDAETALEAVARGLGVTLLPTSVGDADARLRRLGDAVPPTPVREVWLLSLAQQKTLRPVKAAAAWLASIPWRGDPPAREET